MTKRSSKQIQESLLEQYKVWRRGSGTDYPGPEMGPSGGFGLGSVTRSPSQFGGGSGQPGGGKPRVSVQQAKELGIVKPDPKVWRRGESSASDARKRAEAFLSGQGFKTKSEPPSVDKPQVAPGSQTAQERLVQQARLAQRGQDTAEPATIRDLIAAVPGLTKTKMAGVTLGGGLAGAGLGLKGAEMLSDPGSAEQERAEWLQKFDAGLQKSDQERQEMQQRIEKDQETLDRLNSRKRQTGKKDKNTPMKENKSSVKSIRTLEQIEQDLRNKLAEQTQSKSRQMMEPLPVPKRSTPAADIPFVKTPGGEFVGSMISPGAEEVVQAVKDRDLPMAAVMGATMLPGGKLFRGAGKRLKKFLGKADDVDLGTAAAARTPKPGEPVPGLPGQYYTGEISASGKPIVTSKAPATKQPEPTVKAEPEASPAAASKPVTEPIPKKPFLQSQEKYLQGLSKEELERLALIKGLAPEKMSLGTKALIGGAAVGLPYLAYKSGVPQMWYKQFQKDPEQAILHPIDVTTTQAGEELTNWITEPTPGSTLPPEKKNKPKNEAAEKPTYTREQYLGWAKKYAEQFDVPLPMVLHAMFKETGWLRSAERMRTATSPTGARGVMQIQPEYAEKGAYKIKVEDLTDPEKNIEAGVRGLAYYLSRHKTPEKALAAYNAGEGGARGFLKTGDVKYLKRETQKYIKDYKDDLIHQLEKFYPKNKDKVAQVATDILGVATGSQTARAADQVPPVAATSTDKKTSSAEKTNVGAKTQTGKPVGSTYTTTDTQGKTTTYTKNAKGQWVTKSGEIMPMPVSPAPAADKQPSKDSEPSWIEKLYRIDQAKDVQSQWAADVAKQEKERKERSKTPKTQQSASGVIEPVASKSPAYQPLLSIEKEKREREQARKSNKPMQAPSFDPEQDPKGWAEYEEYMQQRQIDAGDRFSREREARLAREKKAAEKSTQQDVSSLLQKDQAGIKSAYKGSAGAQAIMQQNPDVIKDINRIQAGSTIKIDGQDYTIKPGDTLDRIARKMKPSVQAVSPEPVSAQGSAQGYDDFRKLIDVAAGMPRTATASSTAGVDTKVPAPSEIKKAIRDFDRQQAVDNLVNQVGPEIDTDMDQYLNNIDADAARDNMRKTLADWEQEIKDREAQEQGIEKFKQARDYVDVDNIELKGADPDAYVPPIDVPIDSKEQARRQAQKDAASDELKETINTESHALHEILKLAGRTK